MKKPILTLALLTLSQILFAGIDIVLPGGEVKRLDQELIGLKLGTDKDTGETVGKIISLINKNRESIIGEGAPKVYFRPHFNGDESQSQGRITHSNQTASIRLEQAFYYTQADGSKLYIPIDGAEVNAYIAGLQKNKFGISSKGKLIEISSSLESIDFKEVADELKEKITIPKKVTSTARDRVRLLDILEMNDTEGLATVMGLNTKSTYAGHKSFVYEIIENENIFDKVVRDNRSRMKPFFVKNNKEEFEFVWRIHSFYGLPLDIDLNLHGEGSRIVDFESHQKNIMVNIWTGSTFNLKKKKRRSGKSYVWQNREV